MRKMILFFLRRVRRMYRLKTIRRFIILFVTAASTIACMFLISNSNLFKPQVYYSLAELESMQPPLSAELARLRALLPYPSNESLAAMHFWLLWRAAVLFPRSNVNHSYSVSVHLCFLSSGKVSALFIFLLIIPCLVFGRFRI